MLLHVLAVSRVRCFGLVRLAGFRSLLEAESRFEGLEIARNLLRIRRDRNGNVFSLGTRRWD